MTTIAFTNWLKDYLLDKNNLIDEVLIDYTISLFDDSDLISGDDNLKETLYDIFEDLELPDLSDTVSEIIQQYRNICSSNETGDAKVATDELALEERMQQLLAENRNKFVCQNASTNPGPSSRVGNAAGGYASSSEDEHPDESKGSEEVESSPTAASSGNRNPPSASKQKIVYDDMEQESEEDDTELKNLRNMSGNANRNFVQDREKEQRARKKEESAKKRESDRLDREKQKQKQQDRKESEKKRTQKSEKRR